MPKPSWSEIKRWVEDILSAVDFAISSTADFSTAGDISTTGSGTIASATTITGGTGVAATAGDITADAGDVVATLGDITAAAGAISAATTVTAGTDIDAVGGHRTVVGPFAAPGAAGVVAADQTNLDLRYDHVTATALAFVAMRAGSVTGISAQLDAAITTAADPETLDVKVTVNGTELVGGPEVAFTTAGAEVKGQATAAKDDHAFAAGDIIGISYTSTTIDNTPVLVASVEIEQ